MRFQDEYLGSISLQKGSSLLKRITTVSFFWGVIQIFLVPILLFYYFFFFLLHINAYFHQREGTWEKIGVTTNLGPELPNKEQENQIWAQILKNKHVRNNGKNKELKIGLIIF